MTRNDSKNDKRPIQNMEALKILMNTDPSHVAEISKTKINRDLCILGNAKQEIHDGFSWKMTKGQESKFYSIDENNNITPRKNGGQWYMVIRCKTINSHSNITCKTINSHSKDLHRLIVICEKHLKVASEIALVQYRFNEEPHVVEVQRHGNSKLNTQNHSGCCTEWK